VKEFPEKISNELAKKKKIKNIKQKNNGKHEEITLELIFSTVESRISYVFESINCHLFSLK